MGCRPRLGSEGLIMGRAKHDLDIRDLIEVTLVTPGGATRRWRVADGARRYLGLIGTEVGVVALRNVHGAYGVLLSFDDGSRALFHPMSLFPETT